MEKNLILGIESSCDDSSIALIDIKTYNCVEYLKISQEKEHCEFGGVVPELAARLHTAALPKLLEKIKQHFDNIAAITVTNMPGLSVSLVGGVSMAKALSVSLSIPLIEVNHLLGHIYSLFLDCEAKFPLGVLLVSGGHTMVLDIDKDKNIKIVAKTGDDSFGESFDKVAKMMNLGYPGGAVIENLAKNGTSKYSFTIPLLHDKRVEYSFSGLKNQVRLAIEECGNLSQTDKENIAFSFQKAAISHIMDKLSKIYEVKKWKNFGVVGGASANLVLRQNLENLCSEFNANLLTAPLKYCSDNALMIARVGVEKYKMGKFISYQNLEIKPKIDKLCL